MTARAESHVSMQVPDLERRTASIVQYGTVSQVKYDDKGAPRVKVKAGEIETGWIPWTEASAGKNVDWNPMDVGEQVVMLAPSGDMEQAVIVGSIHQDSMASHSNNPDESGRQWEGGAKDVYNRSSKERRIVVPAGGKVVIQVGSTEIEATETQVRIKTGTDVILEADTTTVVGDLVVTGNTSIMGGMAIAGEMTGEGGGGHLKIKAETIEMTSNSMTTTTGDMQVNAPRTDFSGDVHVNGNLTGGGISEGAG